jgi:hypothetical protein
MHRFVALAFTGCSAMAAPTPQLPWVRGFTTGAATDVATRETAEEVARWASCEEPCTTYGGMAITADVAPAAGDESIVATFAGGLVVVDAQGQPVARSPGFDATGTADELVAIAAGDAMLDTPVIAIAARVGGHRESETWLELYRVGSSATLERLFAGVVEEHEDKSDWYGTVTFMPHGLIYRAPKSTQPDLWVFDARAGRYMYRGAYGEPPEREERRPARERDGVAMTGNCRGHAGCNE